MQPEEYKNLKEEIIKCAGNDVHIENIKMVLQKFLSETEGERISKRTLHRVRCIKDFLELLEDRDCLSADNVDYLYCIASALGDSSNEVLKLIKTYKKLRGLTETYSCEVCSHACLELVRNSEVPQQYEVSLPRQYEVPQPGLPVNENTEDNITCVLGNRPKELVEAIQALSTKLNVLWPVLLRELELKEGHIMKTRESCGNDLQKQAKMALDYWSITDPKASVDKLRAALKSSECSRRGLTPQAIICDPYTKFFMS